jgi:hypothetical protein
MASLAELQTGVANSSLFNDTAYYSGDLKPMLADQCSRGQGSSITTVVMTEAIAAKLALVPECRAVFMTDQVRALLLASAGDTQPDGEPVPGRGSGAAQSMIRPKS